MLFGERKYFLYDVLVYTLLKLYDTCLLFLNCSALLIAFQGFCECVGDLEMGKVHKPVDSIITNVMDLSFLELILKW